MEMGFSYWRNIDDETCPTELHGGFCLEAVDYTVPGSRFGAVAGNQDEVRDGELHSIDELHASSNGAFAGTLARRW